MAELPEVMAFAVIKVSVSAEVDRRTIDSLMDWFAAKYQSAAAQEMARDDWTELLLHVRSIYNPHRVAKKVQKKLKELLAATP